MHTEMENMLPAVTYEYDISVVIPLLNEEESLPELEKWIRSVMKREGFRYEVIMVDDGSTDNSWNIVKTLAAQSNTVKGIRFRRNYGKSAALNVGFAAAMGEVVITMDADLQDSPDEIPELYKMITKDNFDLVSGWKKKRHDPLSKTIPTKLYNGVTRMMSGIKLNDMNCGLKAYKNDVIKNIEVYGEMHRYIPVIAKAAGFKKIGEKVVQHQARKYGKTKFGMRRFINGPLDLMSILFISRFGKKPMHFFGSWGIFSFFIGFVILTYLVIMKFAFAGYGMTDRPIFFLGILTIIIGFQLFLTGFLAELVARTAPNRNNYSIREYQGMGEEKDED
jgi:glycosyltransferase involved in cell wall biosynthesis